MKVVKKEDKNSNIYIKKFATIPSTEENDSSNIIVYMADGSCPRYENIKESKKRLLELMYNQHFSNEEELDNLLRKRGNLLVSSIVFSIITLAMGSAGAYSMYNYANSTAFAITSLGIASLSAITTLILTGVSKRNSNKIDEIKKYSYFDENKEILNQIDLENANNLEKVSTKDKKEIRRIKEVKDNDDDTVYFDINSIDNLSLDSLKRLKSNIDRENYLGLAVNKKDLETPEKVKTYILKDKH